MIDATFDGGTRYRMLETVRAFGLDRLAAAGEADAAGQHLMRWAVELTAWIDTAQTTDAEPQADAVLRRELTNLRAAWHLARRQPALNDAVEIVLNLSDACGWRDLTEPWEWTEDLAARPELASHPREAAVHGAAANVAYMRGNFPLADRLARAGLDRATDAEGSWRCLGSLALADLSRGAHAEVIEHARAAATFAERPSESLGVAALAAAYAGQLAQARELNDQLAAAAESPTLRAFAAFVTGEIISLTGVRERAEQHYSQAIDLARASGATFLVGIASVGLVTIRVEIGRLPEALRGYRDLIEYWDRSGNWTQQWVTMRNLAQLLRRLGEDEAAVLLDTAAEHAPDAPPVGIHGNSHAVHDGEPFPHAIDRSHVLQTAKEAIQRSLSHP